MATVFAHITSFRGDCPAVTNFLRNGIHYAIEDLVAAHACCQMQGCKGDSASQCASNSLVLSPHNKNAKKNRPPIIGTRNPLQIATMLWSNSQNTSSTTAAAVGVGPSPGSEMASPTAAQSPPSAPVIVSSSGLSDETLAERIRARTPGGGRNANSPVQRSTSPASFGMKAAVPPQQRGESPSSVVFCLLRIIVFALLIAVDATLRGISQVFLCDNPISGVLITIGLCISTDVQLGPLSLVGSFAGLLGGLAASVLAMIASKTSAAAVSPAMLINAPSSQSKGDLRDRSVPLTDDVYCFGRFSDALHHGLYGYDGSLVSAGTRVFLSPFIIKVTAPFVDDSSIGSLGLIYAVGIMLGFICGAMRGGISRGVRRAFGLPTLTLTFNTVILLSLYALGGPSGAFDSALNDVTSAASAQFSVENVSYVGAGGGGASDAAAALGEIACCLPASSLCAISGASTVVRDISVELLFPAGALDIGGATCGAVDPSSGSALAAGWVLGSGSAVASPPATSAENDVVSDSTKKVLSEADPALLDISSGDWAVAVILGVSQFMFVDTLEGGILVLVGIVWSSVVGCALAVLGSVVSLFSAVFLIKLSYRKTSAFAANSLLDQTAADAAKHYFRNATANAAAVSSSFPPRTVALFQSASSCPSQLSGGAAELSTICVPMLRRAGRGTPAVSLMPAVPMAGRSSPWTVPVSSVKSGLAGYNGGGTMACLGMAVINHLARWRRERLSPPPPVHAAVVAPAVVSSPVVPPNRLPMFPPNAHAGIKRRSASPRRGQAMVCSSSVPQPLQGHGPALASSSIEEAVLLPFAPLGVATMEESTVTLGNTSTNHLNSQRVLAATITGNEPAGHATATLPPRVQSLTIVASSYSDHAIPAPSGCLVSHQQEPEEPLAAAVTVLADINGSGAGQFEVAPVREEAAVVAVAAVAPPPAGPTQRSASLWFEVGFLLLCAALAVYCLAAVLVTSIFFAALPTILPCGAPVMTLPFVLTTYIFFSPISMAEE